MDGPIDGTTPLGAKCIQQAKEYAMPSPHNPAAEFHYKAAHAHEAAAAAHDKGDHLTAHELSRQAHEYSIKALEYSKETSAKFKASKE
jgi:hypothetical protein